MAVAGHSPYSCGHAEGHFVRFYEAGSPLIDEVTEFADRALRLGGHAILIATRAHLAALGSRLRGFGCPGEAQAQHSSRLVTLDAELTLSRFMVDGWPDEQRFVSTVGAVVAAAAATGGGPVHAFGEMVGVLCERGEYEAALRLEALWNELASRYTFTLFCAYSQTLFASAEQSALFEHVCSAHTHVLPSELLSRTDETQAHRLVAVWRQKAMALEREIERRAQAEAALVRRERELADFVENAAEGLHRIAGDGTIVWANSAELDLLGYAYDEYVGHPISEFYVERAVIESILEKLAAGETIRDELVRLRCRDGSIKHVLLHANAMFENGKLLYTRGFTRDATDRMKRQAAERQRDGLFMNAPVAAALLSGPTHVFELANRRFRELAGYAELTGRRYAEVFPESQHGGEIGALLHAAFERGEQMVREDFRIDMTRPDGAFEPRYFTFHLEPLRLDGTTVDGVIAVAVEVTEQVRTRARFEKSHAERERLLAELREASRAKDEFLAMLGHELRNPLSPIVTALRLMRMRSEGGTLREQNIIARQVDHLVRLVDDLLDISRITRGKIDLKKQTVRVADVLTNAVEMASFLIERRGHRLTIDVDPDLVWNADATRLAQVVSNLLTNAARYTPPGGRIDVQAKRERSGMIAVSIRDNGVGLAPEVLPRVFDLFFQGKRNLDRAEGGLGIGLALVKNLVEMHGGGVSAASDGPGRGSTFVIRVPGGRRAAAGDDGPSAAGERGGPEPVSRGHAAGTALDPGRHRVEEPGIAGRRVLLVDDNVDGVQALAELLRECGHRVEAVFDPASALRLVPRFEPEIAVIDIGLPGMDGYELVRRLRAEQASRSCLFVALTGYGQDADRQRSRAAGFHHHFVKPLDPGRLLSLIDGVTPRIDTSAA
ncbi:ATP-binding protein [Trinickia diaoshuihuensis]|uniref:hybrid sensor histidine kinase/response regulator n=1 Tax=Trinickia diaoshuihuensis TaxID=2292265 RepID=UPI000E22BAE2|nr:ATP-binding protein [Trinickia diaoshuihuensis]